MEDSFWKDHTTAPHVGLSGTTVDLSRGDLCTHVRECVHGHALGQRRPHVLNEKPALGIEQEVGENSNKYFLRTSENTIGGKPAAQTGTTFNIYSRKKKAPSYKILLEKLTSGLVNLYKHGKGVNAGRVSQGYETCVRMYELDLSQERLDGEQAAWSQCHPPRSSCPI